MWKEIKTNIQDISVFSRDFLYFLNPSVLRSPLIDILDNRQNNGPDLIIKNPFPKTEARSTRQGAVDTKGWRFMGHLPKSRYLLFFYKPSCSGLYILPVYSPLHFNKMSSTIWKDYINK